MLGLPALLMAGLATLLSLGGIAHAVTWQVDAGGKLTGATGVDIAGTLYNVLLRYDTCAVLFSGCDDSSDILFQSESAAIGASQALLDQVLVDVSAGNFGSDPGLVGGCEFDSIFPNACYIFTPYFLSPGVHSHVAVHNGAPTDFDGIEPSSVPTSATATRPYAIWSNRARTIHAPLARGRPPPIGGTTPQTRDGNDPPGVVRPAARRASRAHAPPLVGRRPEGAQIRWR